MSRPLLVAMGDSLTYGFPYSPGYSWVRMVGDALPVRVVNRGICGETTEDMRYRFAADVLSLRPDYVIITGGSNDAYMGFEAAEVIGNVAAMAAAAVAQGIKTVIGLAPPADFPAESLLAEYRAGLRKLAADNNLPVLDFFPCLVDPATGGIRRGLHVDGVHPSEAGYARMGAAAISMLVGIIAGGTE